jgi:hypothetical protein
MAGVPSPARSPVIAAASGWRVVLVDRENGGSIACPVVAWSRGEDEPRFLDAFYAPNEEGQLPRLVDVNDLLGFLAPGDDHDAMWGELADAQRAREDEAEERRLAS